MDIRTVIERLKAHETELRTQGVARLSVFGSTARGEADALSDVDLAAEFIPNAVIGVTGLGRVQRRIADILGVEVDLIEEPVVRKPTLQSEIDETRVVAF